jgi:hypothetical protein
VFLLKLHDCIGGSEASQSQELTKVWREISIARQEMVVLDQIYKQVWAATSEVSEPDREYHRDHKSDDSMGTLEGDNDDKRLQREWQWSWGLIRKDTALPSFQPQRKALLSLHWCQTSETEEETTTSTHSDSDSSSLAMGD